MPAEIVAEDGREAMVAPTPQRVAEAARTELGVRRADSFIGATGLVVLNVNERSSTQQGAVVFDFAWGGGAEYRTDLNPPRHSSPTAQLDRSAPVITRWVYNRRRPCEAADEGG